MSGVPYVFGNATTSIPLSQLDVNFATNATIGTTSVGLGNTTTTLVGLTNVSTTVVNTSNVSANTSLLLQTNGTTTAVTIDASGNLLVGQTSAGLQASGYSVVPNAGATYLTLGHQTGTTTATPFAYFGYNAGVIGSITQAGTTGVLYNITSDRRLKTDIVDFTDSGKYIDAFKPRSFTWITDNSQDIGFITDEYQETLPSAISGQPNATKEEEYEVTPAVKDEQGNITTPAVMGTRTVPVYQQGDFSTSAKMAIIIAELKSIRERLKTANIA